jgi:drug/metabolite transporter (DMT)-like permease
MCALAGVLFFQERMTPLLATGIGFTIAGLMLLGIRRANRARQ